MNFPEQQTSSVLLTFPVNSFKTKEIGEPVEFSLKTKNLGTKINYVIHRAYITQRYNQRHGSANTLTRAEVRGGGRKPWRQKGTGRARAGSNRSPLWRGGGVSFGPKSKVYLNKINRKEWRLALRSLLVQKHKDITILEDIGSAYQDNKTNTFIQNFAKFGIKFNQKTLIIIDSEIKALQKITKNIKTIKVLPANRLNIKEVIYSKQLFITKDSLKLIQETYNG
uniref:Large ribosomal subunit protein uL4c n=1 Tax=Dictyopteris divaricata TaxID=156996 RepID=A0A2I4Q2H2_9PHAE|nr:50S ribosomal protein L4 [Dictyopteris divaricata]YP_010205332.1 50S ribosomal protein L4 [Grateloupia livida]AQZ25043.1 50S ribosomal protein L4 [Dictyopteris divaricata]UAV85901.1 50S ribosomal protein L4 [Grateloupia livida]